MPNHPAALPLVVLLTLMATTLSAQASPDYPKYIAQADSLYRAGQYAPAARAYSEAFRSFGWKGYTADRYNAALTWTLAGVPDSAFFQLERIATKGNFDQWKMLNTDTTFARLKNDPRWLPLFQRVQANSGIDAALYNEALAGRLDSLCREDQRWRNQLTALRNAERVDSAALVETRAAMIRIDSLNYFELQKILATYGFPNHEIVGASGTHNFWLLMQHQDRHPDFQENVLGMMEKEVAAGKAAATDYAYLLDRVRVNTDRLQVYGTQMQLNAAGTSYEPRPVEAPEKLNERRASVGLGTIEAYIETMNRRYFGSLRKN